MAEESGMQMLGRRVLTAVSVLVASAALDTAPAHAAPPLPAFCVPPDLVGDVCSARVTGTSAEVVDGTLTARPVVGGAPITVSGQLDAYRTSTGFGEARPDPVREWDDSIEHAGSLDVDQYDPAWYAKAKTKALLPRSLNELATRFPADSLLVRFTSDDTQPGSFRLVSIQPTPRP